MKICKGFILSENGIDRENFANVQTTSVKLDNTEIAEKVEKFVLQNFREIRRSEMFLEMPLDYQTKILDSSDLKIDKETDVLETALEIIKRDPDSQSELLGCVRLENLDHKELTGMAMDF